MGTSARLKLCRKKLIRRSKLHETAQSVQIIYPRQSFGSPGPCRSGPLRRSALFAQTVEEMRLTVGKSIVLDYPGDIRQMSTSDPAIVDAVAVSTREVLLNAKAAGTATVVVWPRTGQRTIYSVNVEQNLEPLRRLLKETFPNGEHPEFSRPETRLRSTGNVSAKEIAERALAMVTPFGKSIVNNLKIAPAPVDKQILLRVRFAELNRNAQHAVSA